MEAFDQLAAAFMGLCLAAFYGIRAALSLFSDEATLAGAGYSFTASRSVQPVRYWLIVGTNSLFALLLLGAAARFAGWFH